MYNPHCEGESQNCVTGEVRRLYDWDNRKLCKSCHEFEMFCREHANNNKLRDGDTDLYPIIPWKSLPIA